MFGCALQVEGLAFADRCPYLHVLRGRQPFFFLFCWSRSPLFEVTTITAITKPQPNVRTVRVMCNIVDFVVERFWCLLGIVCIPKMNLGEGILLIFRRLRFAIRFYHQLAIMSSKQRISGCANLPPGVWYLIPLANTLSLHQNLDLISWWISRCEPALMSPKQSRTVSGEES